MLNILLFFFFGFYWDRRGEPLKILPSLLFFAFPFFWTQVFSPMFCLATRLVLIFCPVLLEKGY